MKKRSQKAFTLIEMVIVIAVIAVLSAIVIPVYVGVVNKAEFAVVQSEVEVLMDTVMTALKGEVTQNDFHYGRVKTDWDEKWERYDTQYYFCIENGVVISNKYEKEEDIPEEYRNAATHRTATKGEEIEGNVALYFHLDGHHAVELYEMKMGMTVNGLRFFELLDGPGNGIMTSSDITVSETTTTVQTYDTFMQAYYDCLTENYGYNVTGSCGYVALGMLLSYYDTYLNDDIIPENYDVVSEGDGYDMRERRNSPGVLFEDYSGMTDLDGDGTVGDAGDYYAYYESINDESLLAKLITIGGEMGYYDEDAQLNQAAGATVPMLEFVLEEYFASTYEGEDLDFEVMRYDHTTTYRRTKTIQRIQEGTPVLMGVFTSDGLGHAVVAYHYDEENDKIYCHTGWHNENRIIVLEDSDFEFYTDALYIEFNTSHSHSDNYKVGDSEYCYCEMEEFSVYSTNPTTVGLQIDLIDAPITTPDSKENEHEIS